MVEKNTFLSKKIAIVSFLATIAVVWQHVSGDSLKLWTVDLLCLWAVPWFFVISGVFFVQTVDKYSLKNCLQKKMGTLLLPYLLWGALSGLVFVDAGPMNSLSCWLRYLGITTTAPVGNSPLWYVRALLIFMLIMGPMLKASGELHRTWAFIAFAVITSIMVKFKFLIGMPASPYWFLLGCVLSRVVLKVRGPVSSRVSMSVVGLILPPLVAARICWVMLGGASAPNHVIELVTRNVGNILMLGLIWFAFDLAFQRRTIAVPRVARVSFFVYCAHMPVVRIVNGLVSRISVNLPIDALYLCEALALPLCVFAAGDFLRQRLPKMYYILSGGR